MTRLTGTYFVGTGSHVTHHREAESTGRGICGFSAQRGVRSVPGPATCKKCLKVERSYES